MRTVSLPGMNICASLHEKSGQGNQRHMQADVWPGNTPVQQNLNSQGGCSALLEQFGCDTIEVRHVDPPIFGLSTHHYADLL